MTDTLARIAWTLRVPLAVLLALVIGSGLILVAGISPVTAYAALFEGAFLDYWGLSGTLVKTSPILLAGLAVILPLRAGLLNIGVEGQIYMGGLLSAMAALWLPEMPGWLHIILCMLAGMLGGGIWGLIPGLLKAYRGINEVILTILLNFIAINIVSYFAGGPMMQEGAPYPYSDEISQDLWLPILMPGSDAHIGVLIGIAAALIMYFLLRYSTLGFGITMVGKNPDAAHYAGVSVRRSLVGVMLVAGALGGLVGAIEVLGVKYRLYHHFSPGFGYDGIVVAFLAMGSPLLAPVAAFFLAGVKAGALVMQRAVGLESTVIEAIQGLIIIFVAASLGLTFNRDKRRNWSWRRSRLDRVVGDTFLAPREEQEK